MQNPEKNSNNNSYGTKFTPNLRKSPFNLPGKRKDAVIPQVDCAIKPFNSL